MVFEISNILEKLSTNLAKGNINAIAIIPVVTLKIKCAPANRLPATFELSDPSIAVIVVPIFAPIAKANAFSYSICPTDKAVNINAKVALLDCRMVVIIIPNPVYISTPKNPETAYSDKSI